MPYPVGRGAVRNNESGKAAIAWQNGAFTFVPMAGPSIGLTGFKGLFARQVRLRAEIQRKEVKIDKSVAFEKSINGAFTGV